MKGTFDCLFNYTGTKLLTELILWVHISWFLLVVPILHPMSFIKRKSDMNYHHWGCT